MPFILKKILQPFETIVKFPQGEIIIRVLFNCSDALFPGKAFPADKLVQFMQFVYVFVILYRSACGGFGRYLFYL